MACIRHRDLALDFSRAGSAGSGGGDGEDEPSGRLPFALPGVQRRFARDRDVDLRHVLLDLTVDFEARSIAGTVTHHLTPLRPDVSRIVLDAVEMDISKVTLGGRPAPFRHDGEKLTVETGTALKERREVRLAVTYRCTPRRGFYFIAPDEARPERIVHGWSQGQDEDSRHWWPVYDQPNEKVTTEMIAHVPKGMAAISNGALVQSRERGRHATWHWRQEIPHVPYLVTLAVGPFEKLEQKGLVPMTTWFLPGREAEARRVVKDTPRMVKLFSDLTGVPYPYEKYDQIFVQSFIFGGMENTTATTLTDLVLHDRRASLDYSGEDLVSHELAHQWWGNLVTCRDWSQGWLNEGFATYFEVVWKEHARGDDEAWVLRRDLRDDYLKEDRESYRRPVVCRAYDEPIELFDAHLYQKGSWVLGMLRHELGDVLFWRALRTYLEENRAGSVETDDLRRAVERTSGRNFERFFEQWIESAGYPELEVTSSWDADRREYSLCVEQQQEGKETPECFHLDLPVRILDADGTWTSGNAALRQRQQAFVFRLAEEPVAVVIDPQDRVLKTVTWKRPLAALSAVLARAPWAPARAEAAEALGKESSAAAVAELARALSWDTFWGVRAAAAAALGEVRSEAALDALLAGREQEHPKARRAVVAALGSFRDRRALAALEAVIVSGDASYFVEAEAASSAGSTRQLDALRILRDALDRPDASWNEVVRCGAIDGLGRVSYDQRDEAIDALLPWTEARRFLRCRTAAVKSLARIGEGSDRVRERLEQLLEDDELRVVHQAALGLGESGSRKSRGALTRLAETALDGRIKRAARDAIRRLGERQPGAVRKLESDLHAVTDENRRMRDRLDRLESRMAAVEPAPGATSV